MALAVVVGATLLAVGVALGRSSLVVRAAAVVAAFHATAATPWPREAIEGTIVEPRDSDERDLLHMPATKDEEHR